MILENVTDKCRPCYNDNFQLFFYFLFFLIILTICANLLSTIFLYAKYVYIHLILNFLSEY